MEEFLVALLFLSVLVLIWAVCVAVWGPLAIIPLIFSTLAGLVIAFS